MRPLEPEDMLLYAAGARAKGRVLNDECSPSVLPPPTFEVN